MLRLGLLSSSWNQKIFFYPDDVKKITTKKIAVFIPQNYGFHHHIDDQRGIDAGATILSSNKEVINQCDIACKIDSYSQKETKLLTGKIAIACCNFCSNVKMLEGMVKNKVTGLAGLYLITDSQWQLFNQGEKLKNEIIIKQYLSKKFLDNKQEILLINGQETWQEVIEFICHQEKNKQLKVISTNQAIKPSQKMTINTNDVEFLDFSYEVLIQSSSQADLVICAADRPYEMNVKFIPKQVAAALKKEIYFINANATSGFCTNFVKNFSKNTAFKKYKKFYYNNYYDLTDLEFCQASQLISRHSYQAIIELCQKPETLETKYNNLIICQDQHVINPAVKKYLQL